MSEPMTVGERVCPDCGHTEGAHLNLVGCCAVVHQFADSPRFKGGRCYCHCERLTGFVEAARG